LNNAKEVLSYTNRMILNTNHNSVRASLISDSSKYLRAQESRLNTESTVILNKKAFVSENYYNPRLDTDQTNKIDFYNESQRNQTLPDELEDKMSKEIRESKFFRDRTIMDNNCLLSQSRHHVYDSLNTLTPKNIINDKENSPEKLFKRPEAISNKQLNKSSESRTFKIDLNKMKNEYLLKGQIVNGVKLNPYKDQNFYTQTDTLLSSDS
jgi:hypothetical protein